MKHTSVKLNTPCEFINITPINPLISKCQIKVCYVQDEPNRNRTVITKEFAKKLANSLPGSPIVGYYDIGSSDYEEHNRMIEITGGKVKLKDTTKPYGFVDLNAKVWFQKFIDDGVIEREYLMTEGYLWTEAYPEAKRIITEGNNQSMELSEKYLDGTWTKDSNGKAQFFIINEAIIEKLCILGEEYEPCFEGATITKPIVEFSFDEDFKNTMYSMMNELKELLIEGGAPMFTQYAVEIGDALWHSLYSYLEATYPNGEKEYPCSIYGIDSIWEEGTQKFAILRNYTDGKLYRKNFTYNESGFMAENDLVEVEVNYIPVEVGSTFSVEEVKAFEDERATEFVKTNDTEVDDEEDEVCPKCEKPIDECECDDDEEEQDKNKKYSLEEIPEYIELQKQFAELSANYEELKNIHETVQTQVRELTEFKAAIEKQDKQSMIDSFYMLSDEDKKDVIDNIDVYSVDQIEAKLSVICVRNKVNFNLEDENIEVNTTFNLNEVDNEFTPAWIKAVQSVAKDIK